MATTTFNGPVRSEKGFQQVNKNTSQRLMVRLDPKKDFNRSIKTLQQELILQELWD